MNLAARRWVLDRFGAVAPGQDMPGEEIAPQRAASGLEPASVQGAPGAARVHTPELGGFDSRPCYPASNPPAAPSTTRHAVPGSSAGDRDSTACSAGPGHDAGTNGSPAGRGLRNTQKTEGGGEGRAAASRHVCRVCGRELEDLGSGRVPRELHPECKRLLTHLRATERAVMEVRFAEGAGAAYRSVLVRIANRIPSSWQRPRDARGRFIRGARR